MVWFVGKVSEVYMALARGEEGCLEAGSANRNGNAETWAELVHSNGSSVEGLESRASMNNKHLKGRREPSLTHRL